MAKRKAVPQRSGASKAKLPSGDRIGLRRVDAQNFELTHPHGVRDCADDLAEVHQMLAAGEVDVAIDELRWLLTGCHEIIEAHRLLGEIAAGDGDLELAQNHFGYAWQLGLDALAHKQSPLSADPGVRTQQRRSAHTSIRLPYSRPANRPFLEAGKGLAWCLLQSAKKEQARQVIEQVLALDPKDPLAVQELVAE